MADEKINVMTSGDIDVFSRKLELYRDGYVFSRRLSGFDNLGSLDVRCFVGEELVSFVQRRMGLSDSEVLCSNRVLDYFEHTEYGRVKISDLRELHGSKFFDREGNLVWKKFERSIFDKSVDIRYLALPSQMPVIFKTNMSSLWILSFPMSVSRLFGIFDAVTEMSLEAVSVPDFIRIFEGSEVMAFHSFDDLEKYVRARFCLLSEVGVETLYLEPMGVPSLLRYMGNLREDGCFRLEDDVDFTSLADFISDMIFFEGAPFPIRMLRPPNGDFRHVYSYTFGFGDSNNYDKPTSLEVLGIFSLMKENIIRGNDCKKMQPFRSDGARKVAWSFIRASGVLSKFSDSERKELIKHFVAE